MVKSPRGRLEAFPPGLGTGGATIGPLPTTLALAGSGTALDCAWAAPGRDGLALWASAPAQVLTSNAAASLSNRFFIDILASKDFYPRIRSRHEKWLEIGAQGRPYLGLVRFRN